MSDGHQFTPDELIARLVRETPPTPREEQRRQLARVAGAIGEAVLAFARAHVGREFRGSELLAHVTASCGPVAPDSPSRVLRALQRTGQVSYRVVSRAESLYEVLEVAP